MIVKYCIKRLRFVSRHICLERLYDKFYIKSYRNNLSNNKNIGLIEVIDNNVNNVKVIKDSIDLFLDEVEKDNLAYNYLGV